jgi:hypothetical protein
MKENLSMSCLIRIIDIMKEFMNRNKNIILSLEERKRLADFFTLLIKIDRRNKKKAKDRKIKGKCNKGPPYRGPYLFKTFIFITY